MGEDILEKLRTLMKNRTPKPFQAYIVDGYDEHGSKYSSESEARRAYISRFTAPTGTTLITDNAAYIWTDSKYYEQAKTETNPQYWQVFDNFDASTLSLEGFLVKNLCPDSCVGICLKNVMHKTYENLENSFKKRSIELVGVDSCLVDEVWDGKPERPASKIESYPTELSGLVVKEKLMEVRKEMDEKSAQILVVSGCDEVAWLLNLRGHDYPFDPLFFGYVLVYGETLTLFVDPKKVTDKLKKHLDMELGPGKYRIEDYGKVYKTLKCASGSIGDGKIWLSDTNANEALVSLVRKENSILQPTPVSTAKLVKNHTEIKKIRNACIKDSVALCCFFANLENSVGKCSALTEMTCVEVLENVRQNFDDYVGPSFKTRCAVGVHSALKDYEANLETSANITTKEIVIINAGAHYKGGSSSVARTFHFGTPSDCEKKLYTTVLKGNISIATGISYKHGRVNVYSNFCVKKFWDQGLDFKHSNGHGLGTYLTVYEEPLHIRSTCSHRLTPGNCITNGPCYYEPGKFGVKIKDVNLCVRARTPYNFNTDYVGFENLTFIPYQRNLIKIEMLTKKEKSYINEYYKKCRDTVGPLLENMGKTDAKTWLFKETDPF